MKPYKLGQNLEARHGDTAALPVIDVSDFLATGAPGDLPALLNKACVDTGFFYLTGHNIPQDLGVQTFEMARRFFALGDEVKKEIDIRQSGGRFRGYTPFFIENNDPGTTRDYKEIFDMARHLPENHPDVLAGKPLHGPNLYPRQPEDFRGVLDTYYLKMCALARNMMQIFALSLDLDRYYFDPYISRPHAQLRLLHYPPQSGEIEEEEIGCGAHSDYGCMTLLATDENSGLQIKARDGQWLFVPPRPGDFIVNIADMMQRWTNDLYQSTIHRVVNISGRERYSIPFFFDPDYDAMIECLPTCCDVDNPPQYEPVMAGHYQRMRLTGAY